MAHVGKHKLSHLTYTVYKNIEMVVNNENSNIGLFI